MHEHNISHRGCRYWGLGSSMFPIARSVCDSLGVPSHPPSLLVILEEQGMPPRRPDCRTHRACGDLWERLVSLSLAGHPPDVQPMLLWVLGGEGALEIGLHPEGFKSSDGFLLLSISRHSSRHDDPCRSEMRARSWGSTGPGSPAWQMLDPGNDVLLVVILSSLTYIVVVGWDLERVGCPGWSISAASMRRLTMTGDASAQLCPCILHTW